MSITRPMLASRIDALDELKYPYLGTPKLDGIRALRIEKGFVSRSFKDIPNKYVREKCLKLAIGLDGELITTDFNSTSSAIMGYEGEPNFKYYVFDYVKDSLNKSYSDRIEDLKNIDLPDFCIKILPVYISDRNDLNRYFDKFMAEGYEGIILRPVHSPYECKRSKNLLKIKCWHDAEAEIIGFEQKRHNENEKGKDNFGHSKRSSNKENIFLVETLGSLVVKDVKTGIEFKIGTGFDDIGRSEIWKAQKSYLGELVKYKYQKEGMKDKPRFPVFLGMRHEDDLSPEPTQPVSVPTPFLLDVIKKGPIQIEQARILKPSPKTENPYRQNLRIVKQTPEAAQAQSVSLTEPYIAKKELEIEAEQLVSTRERNLKIATDQCPKLTPQIVIEGLANLIGRAEIAKNMINKQGLVISNNKGLTIPNPALKIEADTLKAIADIFKKINASKKDAKLKNSDIIKPPRHRVKIHYSGRFEDSYFWMD